MSAVDGLSARVVFVAILASGCAETPAGPSVASAAPAAAAVLPPPQAGTAHARRRVRVPTEERPPPWVASSADRWQSALDHYAAVATPDDAAPASLAAPFNAYVNRMHERIHPVFSDRFLDSLARLPQEDPLSNEDLTTEVEIVLGADGRVARLGVLQSSGLAAFDVGVLDSIDRAQPFDPAPQAIQSSDGNVYVHWILRRNEIFACSTMGVSRFTVRQTESL